MLIAHGDMLHAEHAAALRRTDRYRAICCPGPLISCDNLQSLRPRLPLTGGADLTIYDPEFTGVDGSGQRYNLAVDCARAHPEVPTMQACSPGKAPDSETLSAMHAQTPYRMSPQRILSTLQPQVREMLATTVALAS